MNRGERGSKTVSIQKSKNSHTMYRVLLRRSAREASISGLSGNVRKLRNVEISRSLSSLWSRTSESGIGNARTSNDERRRYLSMVSRFGRFFVLFMHIRLVTCVSYRVKSQQRIRKVINRDPDRDSLRYSRYVSITSNSKFLLNDTAKTVR